MNKATAKALEQSINHWKRMRDGKPRKNEWPIDMDCSLCKRFKNSFYELEKECVGCPIFIKTGKKYCYKTPYDKAYKAFHDQGYNFGGTFTKKAQKMIDFLESLRDVK